MSYIAQMLEQDFPRQSFFGAGSMLFKAIEPFRPGDTVTFTGSVTGKRQEEGNNFVDCKIIGTNQKGNLIGVAESTLSLD
jgi:acyl dehydratase